MRASQVSGGSGRRWLTPWVIASAMSSVLVIAAVAVSVLVASKSARAEHDYEAAEIQKAAQSVSRRMDQYIETLRGTAAWIGVTGWPEARALHDYLTSVNLEPRYPGIQVVSAATLVRRADLAGQVAATQADVTRSGLPYPPLTVHPETTNDQLLLVTHIEPQAGNHAAFGFDLFSESTRRIAAEQARDTGQPTMTAPLTLVQEPGRQRATLVMAPVYRHGAPLSNVDERRQAFVGVVSAAFRSGDLLEAALGATAAHVEIHDTGVAGSRAAVAADDSCLLFRGSHHTGAERSTDRWIRLTIAGRTWTMYHHSSPKPGISSNLTVYGLLSSGTAIALLIGILLHLLGSARTQAQALADKMTAELRSVTEYAPDAIIIVDARMRVISWNAGAEQVLGWGASAVLGQPVCRVLPARMFRTACRGTSERIEFETTTANGDRLVIEGSIGWWSVPKGEFATAVLRDVTARRREEAAARGTSELLQSVLRAATEVSIIAMAPDGTITLFNAGAERMLGYQATDVIGRMTTLVFHDPDEIAERARGLDVAPGIEVLIATARDGAAETRKWTYVRTDGSRLPVQVSITGRYDTNEVLTGYIAVATDLSEPQRLQREYADLAAWAELLVNSADDGVCGVSVDGTVTFANRRAAELTGWEVGELVGRNLHSTVHHSHLDGTPYPIEECPVAEVLRTGVPCRVDSELFWRRDGTAVPVEYSAAPLASNGKVDGAVLTFSDITDRKKAEQVLRDVAEHERHAAERLREIDKVRTELISTVSHELRTPLTSILGYLELVLDGDAGPVTDDQREMIEPAHQSAVRLLLLVENLRTLSTNEASVFSIVRQPVEVGSLLRSARVTIAPVAAAAGVSLHTDFGDSVGVVLGDSVQLERAVLNLLTNAVKFTLAGGTVSLTAHTEDASVVIVVTDTGIGIPVDEQPKVFAQFFRSSTATARAIQGAGLGLAIVKHIVDEHGGAIVVESEPGQGTSVAIRIPTCVPVEATSV